MPPTRRYICSFCAKSFSRSEHKSRHERSHTNEKPFSCSICFAKFVRRDLLQRHLRTVHNEQNPSKLITTSPAVTPEPAAGSGGAYQTPTVPPSPQDDQLDAGGSSPRGERAEDAGQDAGQDEAKFDPAAENATAEGSGTGSRASAADLDEALLSSNIISSNFYSLSERNLILLLTLSKKFANLDLVEGKLVPTNHEHNLDHLKNRRPIISSSKISNYLLIWGTISNIKFPVVLNLNKILTLSTIPASGKAYGSPASLAAAAASSSAPGGGASSNSVFTSALFYAVLAFGAAEFGQFSDCLKLFNTCWCLIMEKMSYPEQIIEPLTILAYISFNYLQELYYFKRASNSRGTSSSASDTNFGTASIHTIFQCLNEVIFLLISNDFASLKQSKSYHGSISLSTINYYKSHGLPIPAELLSQEAAPHLVNANIDNELFNYWYTYNLVSSYALNFGKAPPKIHSIFLEKILPTSNDYHLMSTETQVKSLNKAGNKVVDINKKIDFVSNETLKDALNNLSKSPSLLKNLITSNGTTNNINSLTNAVFPSNTFKNLTLRENCIIMGLSNELQSLRLNESNLFNNNKNSLHNSIIMANKSLNSNSNYQQFNTSSRSFSGTSSTPVASTVAPNEDSQYSLLLNSPYSSHVSSPASVTYSRNVSTFGSKSHGVHSPNEPNLNIVNNTTINSNSNYLFNVNNFSNMIINNNINQDLINIYNLIIILKKKILINCDNKLIQDLLIDYIIIPNHEIYWNLLYITIKEFTFINSDFTQWNELDDETMKHKFQQSYYSNTFPGSSSVPPPHSHHPSNLHGSASFSNGAYGIGPYANNHLFNFSFNGFADLIHDIMRDVNTNDVCLKITKFLAGNNSKQLSNNVIINNNLGLASLPLLFIGYLITSLSPQNLINEGFRNFNVNSPEDLMMNFLNLNAGSMSNNNLIFLKYFLKLPKNFVNLLIENFLILIKIFYSFRRENAQDDQSSSEQESNFKGQTGSSNDDDEHIFKKQKLSPGGKSNDSSETDPEIAEIITSPILQSIIYLIREMGSNLKNDDFLMSCNVSLSSYTLGANASNPSGSQIDNLLNAKDDVALYFYLKNIEILFISWLNFLNFGNNQFIQNNNNVIDNYLTRLIKYIELTMNGLYKTLDIGDNKTDPQAPLEPQSARASYPPPVMRPQPPQHARYGAPQSSSYPPVPPVQPAAPLSFSSHPHITPSSASQYNYGHRSSSTGSHAQLSLLLLLHPTQQHPSLRQEQRRSAYDLPSLGSFGGAPTGTTSPSAFKEASAPTTSSSLVFSQAPFTSKFNSGDRISLPPLVQSSASSEYRHQHTPLHMPNMLNVGQAGDSIMNNASNVRSINSTASNAGNNSSITDNAVKTNSISNLIHESKD